MTYDRNLRALPDVIAALDGCLVANCSNCEYGGDGCHRDELMADALFWLAELVADRERFKCERDIARMERDALREKLPPQEKKRSVWRRIKEKENGKAG